MHGLPNDGLPEQTPDEPRRGSEFIFYAALFEGGLILLALLLGWFGMFDPDQALRRLSWSDQLCPGLLWGLAGTIPLLSLLLLVERLPCWPFRQLSDVTERMVKPLFAGTAVHDLLLVSLLAGWGEELLFRWSLQGGLGAISDSWLGQILALLIASLLFGLCHYLNAAYAFFTFLIGLYFGGLMWLAGSWIAPAVSHALYDFIALLYLTRWAAEKP